MQTQVTILCITYNHEKFIAQALDSFVMQKTNFPFVALVADDCSTDNTQSIIKEYAQKYPHIIKPILRDKNIGIAANYLDIASRVDSPYVAFNQGDDFFTDENKLQEQYNFLEKNPDFAICFHPVKMFYDDYSQTESIHPTDDLLFNKKY